MGVLRRLRFLFPQEPRCGWAIARQIERRGGKPVTIAEIAGKIVYISGRQHPGPFSSLDDWQQHLSTLERLRPWTSAVATAIEQAERQIVRIARSSGAQ